MSKIEIRPRDLLGVMQFIERSDHKEIYKKLSDWRKRNPNASIAEELNEMYRICYIIDGR